MQRQLETMETHYILWVWANLEISKYQEDHDDGTYENALAKVTCAVRIESEKKASSQLQGRGSKMIREIASGKRLGGVP